jgi:hypothetical protein
MEGYYASNEPHWTQGRLPCLSQFTALISARMGRSCVGRQRLELGLSSVVMKVTRNTYAAGRPHSTSPDSERGKDAVDEHHSWVL